MSQTLASLKLVATALVDHLANYGALVDEAITAWRRVLARRAVLLVAAFIAVQAGVTGFVVIALLAVEQGFLQRPGALAIPVLLVAIGIVLGVLGLRALPRPAGVLTEIESDLAALRQALEVRR